MEYRRTRRSGKPSRKPFDRSVFAVVCVSIALIYAISFSDIGTWTAQNLIAPIVANIGKRKTEIETLATGTETAVTERFNTPVLSVFALQFGAFEDSANAEKQAISLRTMGAAGYVMNDETKYRVLGASYLNESDAKQVRDRLQTEGVECVVYRMQAPQCELLLSGTEQRIDRMKHALEMVVGFVKDLSQLSISYDAENSSAEDIIATIKAHQKQTSELLSDLEQVDGDTLLVTNVRNLLEEVDRQLSDAESMQEKSKPENSAYLKHLVLKTAQLYCDFCSAISEDDT